MLTNRSSQNRGMLGDYDQRVNCSQRLTDLKKRGPDGGTLMCTACRCSHCLAALFLSHVCAFVTLSPTPRYPIHFPPPRSRCHFCSDVSPSARRCRKMCGKGYDMNMSYPLVWGIRCVFFFLSNPGGKRLKRTWREVWLKRQTDSYRE